MDSMSSGGQEDTTVAANGEALRKSGSQGDINAGKVWIVGDLLCERFDTQEFIGTKICRYVFRSSAAVGSDAYSHVFASITGIDRIAVVE